MSEDESTHEDEQEEYEEDEEYENKRAEDNDVEEQEEVESDQDPDDDEDDAIERREIVSSTNAAKVSSGRECEGIDCLVKEAQDIFEGSSYDEIVKYISQIVDDQGGLRNFMTSGEMESTAVKMVDDEALDFIGLDLETGAILSAIAGNTIFNVGGRDNSLSIIGKIILDNIVSGKFKKDVEPFVPAVATHGAAKLGLNFYEERDKCMANKVLFVDPEFPATDSSLYYDERPKGKIEWKRPSDIVENPQFIVGETSTFDVEQGGLGDCWFMAAVATLTQVEELFYRVVLPDQSFTENYAGIFHFRFWRYGKWVEVVIDDRLPVVNDELYSMHSHEENEFWSALLEKAYAKLYGSYENLKGGFPAEALEDLTGGLTESYDLRKVEKKTILARIMRAFQMTSLCGCITEKFLFHSYEWNGAWSDNSPEWNDVDSKKRAELLKFANDGEFWMSFVDFYENFRELGVCHLSADVMNEITQMTGLKLSKRPKHQWEEQAHHGEWSTEEGTAGGSRECPDSYARNPQFETNFIVTEDSVEQDGKCTVIVAVLQKHRREMMTIGEGDLSIGFSVYEANSDADGAASADFLLTHEPIASTEFTERREVSCRFRVPSGNYIIVPCTDEPECDGEFLLRIFVNGKLQSRRLQ
ncbi:hypothetical protein Aduo_013485 [Ancylostoma duodenale]